MKKSKTIFIIVFSLLLTIMSVGIISLYDGVKENETSRTNFQPDEYDIETMTNHLELFVLAMAQDMDEQYNPVQTEFSSAKDKQVFESEWNLVTNDMKKAIANDYDFAFSIKDTKTGKVKQNNIELLEKYDKEKDKCCLYQHLVFDENGELSYEGDYSYWFDDTIFYNIFDGNISYYDDEDVLIDTSNLKFNPPKNLDMTFFVPQKIDINSGIISSIFYRDPQFHTFTIMSLLICVAVLALFVLLYPIRVIEEVNPFYTIKQWKAEILLVLLTGATVFFTMGCLGAVDMTLTNRILHLLQKYQIGQPHLVEILVNFGIWMATFFIITCVFFMIKYILVYGLWKYIKEKTLLGTGYRYIKDTFLKISDTDLSDSLNKTIMKYILVNMGVIMMLIALDDFGVILAIVYSIASFFYIKNEMNKIEDDYHKLLKLTNDLSNGNFENEINEDLGLFNSLKDQLNTVKTGFEKAVKEEIKSQNMKTELISNVSHDLKTPITCIKNYVYLLKDENLDSEQRKQYVLSLEQYTNRLTSLIEDLFEVSKVNSGNIQLNCVHLNIVALLEQTIAESEEILNSKELQVVKNYDEEDIQLYLDGDKTYRVFENLITNIGKYALSHSRVYIDVKSQDDKVTLEFKNISENQMNFTADEIVERFVRGDKSRHEMGSGLGLAIAKSFVEAQNGKFSIYIDGDLFKIMIIFYK